MVDTDYPVLSYGTLKRGNTNHHLMAGAEYIGDGKIKGIKLYHLGESAMIVPSSDPGQGIVCGELFVLDSDHLARLDKEEGHPSLYERQLWTMENGSKAWVYMGREELLGSKARLIEDGVWMELEKDH